MANKYRYIKVIQCLYASAYGWEDVAEYEREDRTYVQDAKEYRLTGYPTRVINRRVLVENERDGYPYQVVDNG